MAETPRQSKPRAEFPVIRPAEAVPWLHWSVASPSPVRSSAMAM